MSDADALVATIAEHFVLEEDERVVNTEEDERVASPSTEPRALTPTAIVASLCVYPLKSAAAFSPPSGSWPLGPNGLLFDREWALVSPRGVVLHQRTCPRLVKLAPVIDVDAGVMRVSVLGEPELGRCEIALAGGSNGGRRRRERPPVRRGHSRDRGRRRRRRVVHRRGRRAVLVGSSTRGRAPIDPTSPHDADDDESQSRSPPTIGLANSAQILLVSQSSVDHLQGLVDGRRRRGRGAVEAGGARGARPLQRPLRRRRRGPLRDETRMSANESNVAAEFVSRFRPNVVVTGDALPPYDEESPAWTSLEIGDAPGGGVRARLRAVRPCERCSAVGVEQTSGERTAEPMLSLSRFRSGSRAAGGGGGGVTFGVLFDVDAGDGAGYGVLSVGDVVRAVGCAAAATAA